jgi:hypothetical protein
MASGTDQLYFQVHDRDEVVVVLADELPDDAEEILDLLTSEALPLSKWYEVARAYLSQNKVNQFLTLVKEATDENTIKEVESFFKAKPTFDLIQFHCGSAAYCIESGKEAREAGERQRYFQEASYRINVAKQLSTFEQLPFLAAGYLHLAKVGHKAGLASRGIRRAWQAAE